MRERYLLTISRNDGYALDPGEVEAATWIDRQMAQVIATGQLLEQVVGN